MTTMGSPSPGALRRAVAGELSLLTRSRRAIVANVSVVVVLGFVSSLTMGEKYVATASMMPPAPPGEGTLDRFVRQLPVGIGPRGVVTVMNEVERVVQSRRIGRAVIEANDLVRVYKDESIQQAFLRFSERLDVTLDDAQMLHLEFWDPDPERAATVLASLTAATDAFYRDTRRSRGGLLVDLVAARLDSTTRRLVEVELALGKQQSAAQAVYPSGAVASELAHLTGRAMMLEVELAAIARFARGSIPLVAGREAELAAITDELQRQPIVALEDLRLRRELALARALRELLTVQLAAAHALAAQEVPYLEVLDPPVTPAVRAWPGHIRVMLATLAIAVASAVLLAHVVSFVDANRDALETLSASR